MLVLSVLTLPAAAQITLEAAWLESVVGQQVQITSYQIDARHFPALAPILEATGPAQTYDFSPFADALPNNLAYTVLPSAAGTPGEGDPHFADANWIQPQQVGGDFYAYSVLREDGFYLLGSIFVQATDTDGNGVLDQSIQKNNPPDPTYIFPLTDGTAWQETVVSTTEGFGVTSEVSMVVDFAVEGWGTLVTPIGSAPALRLRKRLTVEGPGGYTTTVYLFVSTQLLSANMILGSDGSVLSAAYSRSDTGTSVEEAGPAHAFRLEQNHPNPFSGATTIPFVLERPGHATLRVFDLMGREVARPIDALLPAGRHTAAYEAGDLAGGVYLYRLQVDGAAVGRPLVVLR